MIQSNNQTLFSTTMIGLILLNPPHPATLPPRSPPKNHTKRDFYLSTEGVVYNLRIYQLAYYKDY